MFNSHSLIQQFISIVIRQFGSKFSSQLIVRSFGENARFHPRQFHASWPNLLIRCSNFFEYFLQLLNFRPPSEHWIQFEEFPENASNWPIVHCGRINFCAQQQLRWSVPKCDHNGCVRLYWFAKFPGQTKIANLRNEWGK